MNRATQVQIKKAISQVKSLKMNSVKRKWEEQKSNVDSISDRGSEEEGDKPQNARLLTLPSYRESNNKHLLSRD